MALTKVKGSGVEGITNLSNATFLTVDSSEQAVIKSEGGAVTTSVQQGLAKAWVNFNGTGTAAIGDSLNNTSLTDNATGQYTVTIANNMGSAEYSVGGVSGAAHSVSNNVRLGLSTEQETPTSTLFRTITRSANDNTDRDVLYSFVQVFGDLA